MVLLEEVNGKLVPRGSEEDIKAYLDYKKEQQKKTRHRSLRSRVGRKPSAQFLHHLGFPCAEIARDDVLSCFAYQPQVEGEVMDGCYL